MKYTIVDGKKYVLPVSDELISALEEQGVEIYDD